MGLVTGEISEIVIDRGEPQAKVRVGSAYSWASLALLRHATVGDSILAEAGVAIAIIEPDNLKEDPHVPGNSR